MDRHSEHNDLNRHQNAPLEPRIQAGPGDWLDGWIGDVGEIRNLPARLVRPTDLGGASVHRHFPSPKVDLQGGHTIYGANEDFEIGYRLAASKNGVPNNVPTDAVELAMRLYYGLREEEAHSSSGVQHDTLPVQDSEATNSRTGTEFSERIQRSRRKESILLHLLYDPAIAEAMLGDLEERYAIMRKESSKHRVDLWYWREVLSSLPPIAWAWLMNKLTQIWQRRRS